MMIAKSGYTRAAPFALIFALHIAGCAGAGYRVTRYTSDDGSVVNHTVENGFTMEAPYRAGERCFLDPGRKEHPDGDVTYHLTLTCVRRDFLGIKRERSLHLVIGRDSVLLSGAGPPVRTRSPMGSEFVTGGANVIESMEYAVPADVLRRLADAQRVNLIVYGGNRSLNGYFNIRTHVRFQRFVQEYTNLHFFEVPATFENGLKTAVFLKAGERISITARGIVSYDSGRHHTIPSGRICTSAGIPVTDQERFTPAGYPNEATYSTDGGGRGIAGSLIGWVGEFHEDAAFLIGERRDIRAERDGYLYLAINDARGQYADNQGEFNVSVRVQRKSTR